MSDSVAWCILAGFKITSVFSRITYHVIESMCEFVVSILELYMNRGKNTVTGNVTAKVQKRKDKAAIKFIEVGCQNEVESERENYNSNAKKPTVTKKDRTGDKNGETLTISGQRFCFSGTDKVIECNLREARKVTVSFDFYPFLDQSTLQLYGPSKPDRKSDTQNKTNGNVTTSGEPLLPTSSNQINDQPNESEVTNMYGSKYKRDFTLDDSCPDENVFEADYRNHTMKQTEAMKQGTESKNRTDSINQRRHASNDKMQGKGDPNKRLPAPPIYSKQCPPAPFDHIQGTAAHIDEHAEQKLSLVPSVYHTVDQKQDYEVIVNQMKDPEPTSDQKNTKITFNQMQGSEATIHLMEDLKSTVEQKKCPVSAVGKEKLLVAAVEQKQGPKAAVEEMQDSTVDVEEIQDPEATVNQKQGPETTVNQKDTATDDDQKKSQEATVDHKKDMKSHVDQNQDPESAVDQNQDHGTAVYQQQDQVAPINQSTDKKHVSPASIDKKSPVDLIDKEEGKVSTLDQSTDKEGTLVNVDIKQGAVVSFKKTEAGHSGEKNRDTLFSAEKKQVSGVPTHKKKSAAFPVDEKQSSDVIVDKKKGDETFIQKTDTAPFVIRVQGAEVPSDKKKGAAALVDKKEDLEVPIDKKQGSEVSVDQKKDSYVRIDRTVDKKKSPADSGSQKQASAVNIHPSTGKNKESAPSTYKEKDDSKREGYTSSAADRKSVSKGVIDKSNRKGPQSGFSEGEATQIVSKTCDKTKDFDSSPEGPEGTKTGASKIVSETSQCTSNVEKVSETSGSSDRVESVSEMTQDIYSIEPTTEGSKCSEVSEVENFAEVSEVSRKDDTLEPVSGVLEDHKALEPDSKTSGDENNSRLCEELLADGFSHQRKSTESDDSSETSDEYSMDSSDNRLEKGPSILIAPDVLLDPHLTLDMLHNADQTIQITGIIEKEYLQDQWDDTDKYFYDHVIEREKEMGHIDPSTIAEEPSDQKAVFETKNKKEKKKAQKDEYKSQKFYGKIVDKYNPMTELPKYYDVISVVESKYLLQKSDIKCYTKQEAIEESKNVERTQNISDVEGSLEIEQSNNERQPTKGMESGNVLAEDAVALEKTDLKTHIEGETSEKSGKTYAEMGARPRTSRRRYYH